MPDPDWRAGFRRVARGHDRPALLALKAGLEADDPALCHGRTCLPNVIPPAGEPGPPVEACCLTVYGPWRTGRVATAADAHREFSRVALGGGHGGYASGVAALVTFWDCGPRAAVRAELLGEVHRLLAADF